MLEQHPWINEGWIDYKSYPPSNIWKSYLLSEKQIRDISSPDNEFNKTHRNCRDEIYRFINTLMKKHEIVGNIISLAHTRTPNILDSVGENIRGMFINCELNPLSSKAIKKQFNALKQIKAYSGIKFFHTEDDIFATLEILKHLFCFIDLDLMLNVVNREQAINIGRKSSIGCQLGKSIVSITTGYGRNPNSTKEKYEKIYKPSFRKGLLSSLNGRIIKQYSIGYRDPNTINGSGGIPQKVEVFVVEKLGS